MAEEHDGIGTAGRAVASGCGAIGKHQHQIHLRAQGQRKVAGRFRPAARGSVRLRPRYWRKKRTQGGMFTKAKPNFGRGRAESLMPGARGCAKRALRRGGG